MVYGIGYIKIWASFSAPDQDSDVIIDLMGWVLGPKTLQSGNGICTPG